DTYGALSMYIGLSLSGKPTFFGDPVSLDETLNTITYWHCGTAACSLARNDTGAVIGTHCNRKIGPTMDFGCKPCEAVTVFRVGRIPNGGFRLFIMGGKALDMPKQFNGTSVVVQPSGNAKSIVCNSVEQGWEPHFVVVYGDIRN
ncbi:MAG: fucose isomerase, partial [Pygmaiobacter sp.]